MDEISITRDGFMKFIKYINTTRHLPMSHDFPILRKIVEFHTTLQLKENFERHIRMYQPAHERTIQSVVWLYSVCRDIDNTYMIKLYIKKYYKSIVWRGCSKDEIINIVRDDTLMCLLYPNILVRACFSMFVTLPWDTLNVEHFRFIIKYTADDNITRTLFSILPFTRRSAFEIYGISACAFGRRLIYPSNRLRCKESYEYSDDELSNISFDEESSDDESSDDEFSDVPKYNMQILVEELCGITVSIRRATPLHMFTCLCDQFPMWVYHVRRYFTPQMELIAASRGIITGTRCRYAVALSDFINKWRFRSPQRAMRYFNDYNLNK